MLCLFFVIIELVIIMEFKVTSNDVMDTIELAQNLGIRKVSQYDYLFRWRNGSGKLFLQKVLLKHLRLKKM